MDQATRPSGGKALQGREAACAMLALLQRQTGLYQQLTQLARAQQQLIAAEDPQPLLKVLGQRQRLTGELQTLAEEMRPLRRDWDETRQTLAPAERQAAEQLIAQTKSLIGDLLASDEQDAQRLRIRKQRTGDALRAVHANRQAMAAYGGSSAPASSGCLDRMHEGV